MHKRKTAYPMKSKKPSGVIHAASVLYVKDMRPSYRIASTEAPKVEEPEVMVGVTVNPNYVPPKVEPEPLATVEKEEVSPGEPEFETKTWKEKRERMKKKEVTENIIEEADVNKNC